MKLKIGLAHLNENGSSAQVENNDEQSLTVHEDYSDKNGVKTCRAAAKALRDAADKFDALALEAERFKSTTHCRINAAKKVPA